MFTSKKAKDQKSLRKADLRNRMTAIIEAMGELPICAMNGNKDAVFNFVNGIQVSFTEISLANQTMLVKNGSASWSFTVDDADQILKSWIVLSKPYYVTQWADVSPPEEKAA